MIKVVLADDHALVREGIKAVINRTGTGIEVVAEAENGEELVALSAKIDADIFVVDIEMPGLNGIEAASRVLKTSGKARVVILSMYDSKNFVEKAMATGVNGYVLKDNAPDEIVRAIKEVYSGSFYLSPAVSKFIVNGFLGQNVEYTDVVMLTHREKEILQLIAEGLSSKDIAERLFLSVNTVNVHRRNIMGKLGVHKQADLVRYALKEGMCKL